MVSTAEVPHPMKMRTVQSLVVFCIIFVGVANSRLDTKENRYLDTNESVCSTPGCVKAAQEVLNHIDETVDPCDDFYQFACGGFVKRHPISKDKSSVTSFNIIGDKILEQLRLVFEEPAMSTDIRPFVLLKQFYKVCTNIQPIESEGLTTAKKLLKKLGGWPVLEGSTWDEDQFDWKSTIYKFRSIGLHTDYIINVFIGVDSRNSSQRVLDIDQSTLGLAREYLINGFENEVVKAYYQYIVDLAVIFGADQKLAQTEMKKAVEFEMRLAEISLPKEERRNLTTLSNPMTVEEMQTKFPKIPWLEYFNHLVAVDEVVVHPSTVVDVAVPKFVHKLEDLLEKTPKRVQANYLLYHAATEWVTYLTQEVRDRELQYITIEDGTQEMEPRWKECVKLAASKLHLAADSIYVRRYFNEDARKSAVELVSNLRNTFISMLKGIDWMDENTKQIAVEKAEAIVAHIAYPQELLDDKTLEDYYSKLNPNTDNFLLFSMDIKKFDDDVSFRKLPKVVNKTEWSEHSNVNNVNAYYNPMENSIQLPAGILQGVFFDASRPTYLNYGCIGFAIGHEITHGFDDIGRQFDKEGAVKEWWNDKTKQAFLRKKQCIIDQYANFTSPEVNMHLNGINTQGENIADNGGVKEAYLAYASWVKRNGAESRLPGLSYSPTQLFWISTANLWCSNQRDEYLRQQILTDPHAPSNFRVLGPLQNSKQFSEDFNCPVGSKMNPVHKCEVW